MKECRLALPGALGQESVRDLLAALEQAAGDAAAGAIVLTGSSEVFCRGLDVEQLASGCEGEGKPIDLESAVRDFVSCLRTLRTAPKPTLALVDGPALGGGVGLAAACDVVVCTERASFAFPEVLFGLIPAMVLPFVLERMSAGRARLWAMTAASRSAEEALAAGLADEVVPASDLEGARKRWLRTLGRAHPRAVAELKRFSQEAARLGVEAALERGSGLTLAAIQDESVRNAVKRFQEEGVLPWEDE